MVVPAVVAGLLVPVQSAAGQDVLPDLGMARLSDLKLDKTFDGRRLLRYSTTIVNVGAGSFEVVAARADTSSPWSVSQRIRTAGGGTRDQAVAATLVFGGDGHGHWHLRDLEHSELIRLDNGSKVGTGAKRGFCFFDTGAYRLSLPGAPRSAFYGAAGCGEQSSLALAMGLSVGWGDTYRWSLPDQYLDITGLTPGRYRLVVTADGTGAFFESSEANNATWIDFQLRSGGAPRIVAFGPAA